MTRHNFSMGSGRRARFSFRPILVAFFSSLFLLAALNARSARASSTAENAALADLTNTLVVLSSQYTQATPVEQSRLLPQLSAVASTRFQQLTALAQTDPTALLRVALPDAIRSALPPVVQANVEATVSLAGALEIFYADNDAAEHDDEQLQYFLVAGDERLALSFVGKPPKHLQTGTFVQVSGVRLADFLVVESSSNADLEILGAAFAAAAADPRILVVLVNFQDNPIQPYTVTRARQVVFEETNNFFRENSFNKASLAGDVYGWYTIPLSSTTCDAFGVRDAANAAVAAAGGDLSSYTHFIYAFPQNSCGFWGSGTVGGNPTYMWVNGDFSLKVVAHEFGHNLGLYHSHALECEAKSMGDACTTLEYGDTLDVMGHTSVVAHFNAFQKERMGWLSESSAPFLDTVETSGTYLLDPYETSGPNPKALKVLKSVDPTSGKKTWYYLERRQALGFDSAAADGDNIQNGVVIHTGSELGGNTSYLLDMTPAATAWWLDWDDPALVTGQTFTDADAAVSIRTLWANDTGAAVSISVGAAAPVPPPCVPTTPTVTLSPARSQWVPAGAQVAYAVQVTNRDSSACSTSRFTVQANVLSGWAASVRPSTLSIPPGGSANATVTVVSPSSTPDGLYPVDIGITRVDGAAAMTTPTTASATYAITSTLNLTLSSIQATYLPARKRVTIPVAAQVSFGGAPVARARVIFSLRRPDGKIVRRNAATKPDGAAAVKFSLAGKNLTGAYELTVTASQKKNLRATTTTSFTVQ